MRTGTVAERPGDGPKRDADEWITHAERGTGAAGGVPGRDRHAGTTRQRRPAGVTRRGRTGGRLSCRTGLLARRDAARPRRKGRLPDSPRRRDRERGKRAALPVSASGNGRGVGGSSTGR